MQRLYLSCCITSTTFNSVKTTTAIVTTTIHNKLLFSSTSSFLNIQKKSARKLNATTKFKSIPFAYHEELTVRVDNLNNLGLGVCRVPISIERREPTTVDENSSSPSSSSSFANSSDLPWVILVPNVIPGELVRIRIYENKKRHSNAQLIRVLEPQLQYRVQTPKCSLAGICGGCQYQHMTIEAQRYWKTKQVQEALNRITKSTYHNVQETLGNDQIWNYRSKLTPHYDVLENHQKSSTLKYEIGPMGFQQQSSHQLIDVPYCPLATEAINQHWSQMRNTIYHKAATDNSSLKQTRHTVLMRDTHEGVVTNTNQYVQSNIKIDLDSDDMNLQSRSSSSRQHNRLVFRYQAGNFFQINPSMIPIMIRCIIQHAITPKVQEERRITHILDCYCGSGLLAIATAAYVQQCVGIEVHETAVQEATVNARLNAVTNCAFIAATAETIFTATYQSPFLDCRNENETTDNSKNVDTSSTFVSVQSFPRDTTLVILDPPRKGCSDEFLHKLLEYRPQRIAYMSCNITTQARDIKPILAAGYTLKAVQPLDLFPHTRHIECLMVMENMNHV
jgi:tRNA (uracil-5-)-methyltransferase